MRKSYSEMIALPTFKERLEYLKINDQYVGNTTFGGHRTLNQALYKSPLWKSIRNAVIIRDKGCDLADPDHPINGSVYIHHINPITVEELENRSPSVFDIDNLVAVSFETHNQIHYGTDARTNELIERSPNDTVPWRN